MGYLTLQHTITASLTEEIASIEVGDNTLISLSLTTRSSITTIFPAYAEIGVLSDGTTADQRAAILAAGYCDILNSLSWTGSLPVEGSAAIYLLVHGTVNTTFRLIGLLLPRNPAKPPGGPRAT